MSCILYILYKNKLKSEVINIFVYVFTVEEARKLKQYNFPFICNLKIGQKMAFVFEDTRMLNFEKEEIKAYKTNRIYF